MDVHVPSAVSDGLRQRGLDVVTAQLDGLREAEDEVLLERATQLTRILFTQDDDLFAICKQWIQQSREFAGVVYTHQLRMGIGETIEDLELIAVCATDAEVRNRVIYLPLN